MPMVTLIFAVLLFLLGVVGYIITGQESITALIPAALGVLLGLCAAWAWAMPSWRKHAMHVAMVLALLGVLGTLRAIGPLVTLLTGGQVERPAAVIAQVIMLALAAAYLALGIKSFIDARRARSATGPA